MTISGLDPALIQYVIVDRLLGIPLEFYYALLLCVALWYVQEHTAMGRRLLFVGRGREVARLSGINTDRVRLGCLVASSLMGAIGGVLYAGTQGAAIPHLARRSCCLHSRRRSWARPAWCLAGSIRSDRWSPCISW